MSRVLVVEDHGPIAASLRENLEIEGYEVRVAVDGIAGIDQARAWNPDLVVLDLMLPGRSGFEVLNAIRSAGGRAPVLVLSARGGEHEKVRAFKAGADDYVVKPFGLLELLARIQVLLHRPASGWHGPGGSERYQVGDLAIDIGTRQVTRAGQSVELRPKEFDLLMALCRARGAVLSRGDLLRRVWGYDPGVVTRTVDTHIAALRSRLDNAPDRPPRILTVRKAGYRIALDAD